MLTFSVNCQNTVQPIITKEFKITKDQTFLNLPVNNSDRLARATIRMDGKPLDRFTINLATVKPEFWTFFDVSAYRGKTLTIEISNASQGMPRQGAGTENTPSPSVLNTKGLDMVFVDSKFPGMDSLYIEKDRPLVHFSAQRGWVNDPNGLIYYKGEYHMYFQHNPYGWQWGNMHWGHAVSKDLIHWKQLGEAIYPVIDENGGARGDAAFSGSAIIDPENTGGFRKNNIDPLIAVYTSTGRGECLKMSYDNGRTFIEYGGNPILKHSGRDPKVFWYTPGKHWVMVVWDSGMPKKLSLGVEATVRQHSIYTSADLKSWTYQSGVSGFFECPDLFQLPVEGEPGNLKWVMYDASGRYIVGDFDGKKFSIEQSFTKYEHGGEYFYAAQTFNETPDGRRIQVGWGRNITQPGMPFNQVELFPSELKLKRTNSGYRLCPRPISEIATLHKNTQEVTDKVIQSGEPSGVTVNGESPVHIVAEFERGDAPITFNILGYELRFDNEWIFTIIPPEGQSSLPTVTAPVTYIPNSDIFKIEAIVDKNVLEFYVNDGELYYVTPFNGKKTQRIEAFVKSASGNRGSNKKFILKKMDVHELNSIWKN